MKATAGSVGFPEEVWMGIKRGEWPVQAFPSEARALRWAAEAVGERQRYIVGPLPIHPDVPVRRARIVPERIEWEEPGS